MWTPRLNHGLLSIFMMGEFACIDYLENVLKLAVLRNMIVMERVVSCSGLASSTVVAIRVKGTMTGERYHEIVTSVVIPTVVQHDLMFQDDNATPHRTKKVKETLAQARIVTLPWPCRSPDLSPVEHAWDELGADFVIVTQYLQQLWTNWHGDFPINGMISTKLRLIVCANRCRRDFKLAFVLAVGTHGFRLH